MTEAIIIALIGGAFTIVTILIEKGRKENKRDHSGVMDHLDLVSSEIRKDIRQVRHELSDHVNGSSHKEVDPPAKLMRKRPKAG